MDKLQIIQRIDGITKELIELKSTLQGEETEVYRFPYYYKIPISDLRLEGLAYKNVLFNACAKHLVTTIGELISHGRASVSRWTGIGPKAITAVADELRERFNVKW